VADWKLFDLSDLGENKGIAGYSAFDALGVRLGPVSGWVTDPNDQIVLFKTTIRDWFKSRDFLVPLGVVSQIDDTRQRLQMRQLTKRALIKQCLPIESVLPASSYLEELIQYFPNPRPSIIERISRTQTNQNFPSWSRLTVYPGQGDGQVALIEEPFSRSGPDWIKIGQLAPPLWKPIQNLFGISYSPKV